MAKIGEGFMVEEMAKVGEGFLVEETASGGEEGIGGRVGKRSRGAKETREWLEENRGEGDWGGSFGFLGGRK